MYSSCAAVRNGIDTIDTHFGNGDWVDKVNPDTLDQASDKLCVLGQVFGDYGAGKIKLFGRAKFVAGDDYGFVVPPGQDDWHDLNVEWKWHLRIKKDDLVKSKPQPGDKVRITFEAVMPRVDDPLASWTLAVNVGMPEKTTTIEVLERRKLPEPGDRVKSRLNSQFATVTKPKQGTGKNQCWVVWDGSDRQAYSVHVDNVVVVDTKHVDASRFTDYLLGSYPYTYPF